MIVDAFLYFNEVECAEVRVHELADVVDLFVEIVSARTFTGLAIENAGVLDLPADLMDRLHWHKATSDVVTDDPWQREAHQRNAILDALEALDLAPDDIILIGDVDEIPSANAVREAAKQAATGVQVAFDQTLCLYYVNNQCVNMRWRGTQAVRYDYLKSVTPQGVRDYRNGTPYVVSNGGWHFSSLVLDDPVSRMTAKIQAFSHQEVNRPEVLDPENIRRRVALGQDIQGRTDVRFRVEQGAVLPRYVTENKERLNALFYPGSSLQ